jgi:hypothetical protein
MPFGGGDRLVSEHSVETREEAPGRAKVALVDARRLDIMMLSIESACFTRCRKRPISSKSLVRSGSSACGWLIPAHLKYPFVDLDLRPGGL